MASINFTMSPAPGVINDMIAVIYKTTAPAAEVDRLPIPAPHTSPVNLSFPNVAPGTYIVKIHETPDGITLGNLHHDFWTDASLSKLFSYTVKTFQVGLGRGTPYYDPADQDTSYINPDIDGLDYIVFKPGYGPLDWNANIAPHVGGGFDFTDNEAFGQDEIYTLLISNLVLQPITSTGTGFPDNLVLVNSDFTFTSAHYNKLIEVEGVGPSLITITMNLGSIPDGTKFIINTQRHNTAYRYVIIQLGAGEVCIVNSALRNTVFIGQCEEATFFKIGNTLRIMGWTGDYLRIGTKIFPDSPTLFIPNVLPYTGGWYLKTDYPRLFEWYVNVLPAGDWESGVDDSTPSAESRKKWLIGINKFWVPDHKDMHYRVTDGVRGTNNYQADAVGPGEVDAVAWTGQGIGHNSLTVDGIGFLATQGDGGSVTPTGANSTNRSTAHTSRWQIFSDAGENRIKNVSTPVFVII